MYRLFTLTVYGLIAFTVNASSANAATLMQKAKSGWTIFSDNVSQTWQHPANKDVYLPAITWHNR